MKRHRGKSWHTLYKEKLLKLEEVNKHLRTVQQKYIGSKEEIMDLTARHKKEMHTLQVDQANALTHNNTVHAKQIAEIKTELEALQIEVQRVKVKDEIAETTEALIAQCLRILGDYIHGEKPRSKEGVAIAAGLDKLKAKYQRDRVLRKAQQALAQRQAFTPWDGIDLAALYGADRLYGLDEGAKVHISEAGKWPEAGMSGDQPTGDPGNTVKIGTLPGTPQLVGERVGDRENKVGIGEVPKVDIDVREDGGEERLAPAALAPENTRPDPKGT